MYNIYLSMIRRATLTEIKEGEEWEWPDPGNLDEVIQHR